MSGIFVVRLGAYETSHNAWEICRRPLTTQQLPALVLRRRTQNALCNYMQSARGTDRRVAPVAAAVMLRLHSFTGGGEGVPRKFGYWR